MKLNLPIRRKLFLSHFLAVIAVCGTVGIYFYSCAVESLKASLQTRLRSSAALLSQILDVPKLDEIREEADQALPIYQEYLELLRTFRRANPDIAYMYVMRRNGDRVNFVIDSDETEKQALPGREYTTFVPAMLEGFSEPSVDDEITTDEWGATLSGYAPIKHGEGAYLIGIDMDASEVHNKFHKLQFSALIALLSSFILAVFLSRFFASRLTTPISLLISRCKAIAEGNLADQVEYRTGDELDGLIDAINNMSVGLLESQEQRRQAEEALKRANEELELRIAERTKDLSELNDRLRKEIDIRNITMDALRVSEERYRELADLLPQPVFEADADGNLTFLNRAAFETFGCLQEDFDNGLRLREMFASDESGQIPWDTRLGLNGKKAISMELSARRKDGNTFPALLYAGSLVTGEKPEGLRGIIVDMSEHKQLEEELLKAQKLESIGILAGGIAHDFNNLLTAILGRISLARNLLQPEEKLSKLLYDAEKASLQARNLTRRLISLARVGAPLKSTFSIRDSISDAAELALSGSNAKCLFKMADDLWPVFCDLGQIHQLVANLVMNSKEAMPEGGVIEIEAKNIEAGHFEVPSLKAGRYVKLTIKDSGVGIPEENLPRVFDPYFSTKARGVQKGMGLGLTLAYSIIKRHEGYIGVRSTPGKGTEVLIYLPAVDKRPKETERDRGTELPSVKGRVLYMDDDEMLRDVAGEMLSHIGYEVQLAKDGADAIELFKEALEKQMPYDLIILDLTVRAGMGGKETVMALRQIDASVKAIVSSGYSDDPVMSDFAEYGFMGAIAKPYQMENLDEVLRSAILGNCT